MQLPSIYSKFTLSLQGSKDAPAPRPNKRPRLGPSPTELDTSPSSAPTKSKLDKPVTTGKSSTQVEEFLEVMQPRTKKGPSWANEARVEQPVLSPEEHKNHPPTNSALLSDLEWMKQRVAQNVEGENRVFEQSDEEDGPPATSEVGALVFLVRRDN